MPRTFRHNSERSRQAGPDLCNACQDLEARHVVTTYPTWGSEVEHLLCDDCCEELVGQLRRTNREYRAAAYLPPSAG